MRGPERLQCAGAVPVCGWHQQRDGDRHAQEPGLRQPAALPRGLAQQPGGAAGAPARCRHLSMLACQEGRGRVNVKSI